MSGVLGFRGRDVHGRLRSGQPRDGGSRVGERVGGHHREEEQGAELVQAARAWTGDRPTLALRANRHEDGNPHHRRERERQHEEAKLNAQRPPQLDRREGQDQEEDHDARRQARRPIGS